MWPRVHGLTILGIMGEAQNSSEESLELTRCYVLRLGRRETPPHCIRRDLGCFVSGVMRPGAKKAQSMDAMRGTGVMVAPPMGLRTR